MGLNFEMGPLSFSKGAVGGRKGPKPTEKMTQYLTPEEGKVRLKELLEGTKALMKVSKDKHDFWEKMDIAYPKLNKDNELLLPFPDLPRLKRPRSDEAAN